MDPLVPLALVGAAWWAASCAVRIGALAAAFIQPRTRRRRATRRDQPPVSIIIPVRRLEPEAAAAFASAYAQVYPRLEVLTTAEEAASPILDLARDVASQFPQIKSRLLNQNVRFTPNPKVSNLAPAIAAARHDLVLIKDSNIRLGGSQLAELVRNLTPGVGLVCAVPIAIEPAGFSAEIECAFLNGHSAPLMYGASLLGLNVGFGKVMLFDRRDFYAAGGIDSIARSFGDDHALAKALARIGLRTVYAGSAVRQVLGRRSLWEVYDRQLRWMVIRRMEEPLAFFLEPFICCAFTALAGAAGSQLFAVPWWLISAATLFGWLSLESFVVAAKGWGWSWRFPLACLCREVIILALWLKTWFTRQVRWAGLTFEVPRGTT